MKLSVKTGLLAGAMIAGIAALSTPVRAQFPLPPQPNGACEYKNGTCQVTPQNICKLSKGTWQGPGTTCASDENCKVEE